MQDGLVEDLHPNCYLALCIEDWRVSIAHFFQGCFLEFPKAIHLPQGNITTGSRTAQCEVQRHGCSQRKGASGYGTGIRIPTWMLSLRAISLSISSMTGGSVSPMFRSPCRASVHQVCKSEQLPLTPMTCCLDKKAQTPKNYEVLTSCLPLFTARHTRCPLLLFYTGNCSNPRPPPLGNRITTLAQSFEARAA